MKVLTKFYIVNDVKSMSYHTFSLPSENYKNLKENEDFRIYKIPEEAVYVLIFDHDPDSTEANFALYQKDNGTKFTIGKFLPMEI